MIVSREKSYFTITELSNEYTVHINSGCNSFVYTETVNLLEKMSIFRVLVQNQHCRHLTRECLFTETEYIAITQDRYVVQNLLLLDDYIQSDEVFSFSTLNRDFYGLKFSIKRIDNSLFNYFLELGYRVEKSELFSLLWPPVFTRNSNYICSNGMVCVCTSFDIVPYENININSVAIRELSNDIRQLHFNDKLLIHKKNVDVCIIKEETEMTDMQLEEPDVVYSDQYIVPNLNDYFLFDKNGCSRLLPGARIYLSEMDKIVGYKNGHIIRFVYAIPKEKIKTKQLISDVLKYHPQTEEFNADEFMDISSDEVVLSYLETCYRSGQINTIIKQYIKEGVI